MDEVVVRIHGFKGGLEGELQLVAQAIRVVVVVLKVMVKVQFKLLLVAHLFHLGTIPYVSIVEEVMLVLSVIGGLELVSVVGR